jgi:hypothetical protein
MVPSLTERCNLQTVQRWVPNALRILGIVASVVFVIAGSCLLLTVAWVIFVRGGLTPSARILHPQAASAFFGAILAIIPLVTAGIVTIVKLIRGMIRSGRPVPNS